MNVPPTDALRSNRFWTVSNALSLTRALLVIPFVLVMLARAPWSTAWAVVITALAVITDKLDGMIARRYQQETEWGRILDPLADKVAAAATALVFLWLGMIPAWFVAMVIVRDLLILAGGLYLKFRTGIVLSSSNQGKWAFGVIGATLLLVLLRVPDTLIAIGLGASAAGVILSLLGYVRRFIEVFRTQKQEPAHGIH